MMRARQITTLECEEDRIRVTAAIRSIYRCVIDTDSLDLVRWCSIQLAWSMRILAQRFEIGGLVYNSGIEALKHFYRNIACKRTGST